MTTIVRIADLEPDALQALRAESSQEGLKFMDRLYDEWASGANLFDGSGEAFFLAVADGRVVGVCGLNRDPYAQDARTGRVRRLFVLRNYRGKGIGRALLDAVIAHAREHFDLLRVRTDAADDFYAKHGFRRDRSSAEATHILGFASTA